MRMNMILNIKQAPYQLNQANNKLHFSNSQFQQQNVMIDF